MIVSSSVSSLSKKTDNAAFNNLLLRTDGFKHVFKGLTYKHSMPKSSQPTNHAGTYTSIGKRTPAKQYHFTKDCESRLQCEDQKSKQFRRTQTAQMAHRKRPPNQSRQSDFLRSQKQQSECFSRLLQKLGI